MSATISVLSTVFIKSRIVATLNGVTYDPTGDAVEIAFKVPGTNPSGLDWHAATWETAGVGVFYAKLLVGPVGGLALALGTYRMWIRVTDAPEVPVLLAPGFLRIE